MLKVVLSAEMKAHKLVMRNHMEVENLVKESTVTFRILLYGEGGI
jgi:hypothetical protein